ncbi:MAG: hypothetical protein AAFP20_22780 [Cyanobacteria bacterium J06614_10]
MPLTEQSFHGTERSLPTTELRLSTTEQSFPSTERSLPTIE